MPTQLPERDLQPTSTKHRVVLGLLYAMFALFIRFAPLPENFACIGGLAFFSGVYLTGPMRWIIPVGTIFMADLIGQWLMMPGMGFYYPVSMMMTYLGIGAFVGVGTLFRWILKSKEVFVPAVMSPLGCILGSFAFFLLSNFGTWLDPVARYEQSWYGLLLCYDRALPFWRSSLVSDVVFGCGFVFVASGWELIAARRAKLARD